MRFARDATPVIMSEGAPLRFGEANVIRYRGARSSFRESFDVLLASEYADEHEELAIVACGPLVSEVMRAALILREQHGLETRIPNMHTVKPLDAGAVNHARAATGAALTCEERQKGGWET